MPDLSDPKSTAIQIKLIRQYLKIKIMDDNITFREHGEARNKIYDLVKRTVGRGESHSALLIGPRGCGKTSLLNSVLHQLSKEVDMESDATVVKLNGLLHQDDNTTLKIITAQMKMEEIVGDRVFGSFEESLSFLLSCLQNARDCDSRSIVFILEQFDMLCKGAATQTLLYNLFDLTHSQRAPMCVIATTNRLEAVDLFEKRVKSRFSHRTIFLLPNEIDKDGNYTIRPPLETHKEILLHMLSMPKPTRRRPSTGQRKRRKSRRSTTSDSKDDSMEIDSDKYSVPIEVLQRSGVDVKRFENLNESFVAEWNCHIQSLMENETILNSLEKLCYYNVNQQIFRNILFQIVCKLSPSKPFIDEADITSIIDNTVAPEHRVKLLQSLSILELSLVIAIKHSMDILDEQPINFEMILHRYTQFANAHSSAQTVPRPVILKAFEHLQELEVVKALRGAESRLNAADASSSRAQKEYQLFALTVHSEDISEAVRGFKSLPTEISHWYNNSVV